MRLIDADALDMFLGSSDRDIYVKETLEEAPTIERADILAGMWESVEVNPPKPETPCWVTDGDKGLELVIRRHWGWKCVASVHDLDGPVTHWMPLPEPPNGFDHA